MQLDALQSSINQVSSFFSGSVKTSDLSDKDNTQGENAEYFDSDSVVTLSAKGLKSVASSLLASPQVRYKMDGESNRIVTNLVDPESGEVIRQIPNEEIQRLIQRIKEYQKEVLGLG